MKMMLSLLLAAVLSLISFEFVMAEGEPVTVPDIETKAWDSPDAEPLRFVRDMKAGWNLGNTFDAFDCSWLSDPLDYETAWCGAKTTEALIEALSKAGIRTLRLPVSWHNHLSADWVIDPAWLDRVEEVLSWAYSRDMYVILNIHHDCAPDYYYPDAAHAETSARYIRTIWSQLADRFQDYGPRLVFECINEPRLVGTANEWYWDASSPACQDAMAQIVALNQVFVDTVRASGGNNADRYLMVPAYDASPEYACNSSFSLPEDPADNRIIVSVHGYTPYSFALQMPGTDTFTLESAGLKSDIALMLNRLYETYIVKGIPVVMGEFGAMEKNGNLQSRVSWLSFYVAQARSRGVTCCWWDNNIFSGSGERFGLFDRTSAACVYPELLEAFMRYSVPQP